MMTSRSQVDAAVPVLPKPYYDQHGITIYLGDCRQIVPLLPQADLLLTDPPYGIKVARKGTVGGASRKPGQKMWAPPTRFAPVTWDDAPPEPWVLQMLLAHSRQAIIFGGNYFQGLGPASCWLVWDKKNGTTCFADCELAWTNLKKAVRKFAWRWNGMLQEDMKNKEKRVHPTQKPRPLMEWCIGHAKDVALVLDPYMGSGTTLVAARKLGLRAIGIDRDASYCASAVERIEAVNEQLPKTAK